MPDLSDAYYRDGARAVEAIAAGTDKLAATPGIRAVYEELALNLDILCGMFSLSSMPALASLTRDIKRRFETECGEMARLNDAVYALLVDFSARVSSLLAERRPGKETVDGLVTEFRRRIPHPSAAKLHPCNSEPPTTDTALEETHDVEPPPADTLSLQTAAAPLATLAIELPKWNRTAAGEMLDTFLEEAEEIITSLDKDLLDLEKNPGNEALVNQIFRSMHTLKGNSATINLKVLNLVAHRAENILSKIRTKGLKLTSGIVDILLDSTEVFKEILKRVINGQDPNLDISALIYHLEEAGMGRAVTPPVPAPVKDAVKQVVNVPAGEASMPVRSSVSDAAASGDERGALAIRDAEPKKIEATSLRVDIGKLDTAMNLIGEIVIDRIRLKQKIHKLADLISAANSIIRALEANAGTGFQDRVNILIEDRVGDYIAKLSIDADLSHLFAAEINSLKQTVNRMMESHVDSGAAAAMMEADAVAEELKRMVRLFKETVQELTVVSEHLNLVSTELQEDIMQMRLVPMTQLFDKLPRQVRTLSKDLDKKVRLDIVGAETELDKTVIEKLGDPLMHMIRNSLDHGIETPAERIEKGKPEEGLLAVSAEHKGNQVEIVIRDDGCGIDEKAVLNKALETGAVRPERAATMDRAEILELIFLPGLSSAKKVTEVSGRGVGMDVVLSTIKKMKGSVEIETEMNKGTAMIVRLPLTMSIMNVQLIKCGSQIFAIPISFVEDILLARRDEIGLVGRKTVLDVRGEITSVVWMHHVLGVAGADLSDSDIVPVVMVKISERRIGFVVGGVVGQQEIVIKTLGDILKTVEGVSGATILGEGNIVLILDMLALFAKAKRMTAGGAGTES